MVSDSHLLNTKRTFRVQDPLRAIATPSEWRSSLVNAVKLATPYECWRNPSQRSHVPNSFGLFCGRFLWLVIQHFAQSSGAHIERGGGVRSECLYALPSLFIHHCIGGFLALWRPHCHSATQCACSHQGRRRCGVLCWRWLG